MNAKSTDRLSKVRHSLSLAFAALVAGSRSIPLGDNGSLFHELALRSAEPAARSQQSCEAARPHGAAI